MINRFQYAAPLLPFMAFMFISSLVAAADAPPLRYSIAGISGKQIKVDGKVTRREWFQSTQMPPMSRLSDRSDTDQRSRVCLGHDDANLFIAFIVSRPIDKGAPKIVLTNENRSMGRKSVAGLEGGEDRVRITLVASGGRRLVLEGNAGSVWTDESSGVNVPSSDGKGIDYKASVQSDHWEGEWTIPLALLNNERELEFDFANIMETPEPSIFNLSSGSSLEDLHENYTILLRNDQLRPTAPLLGNEQERLAVANVSKNNDSSLIFSLVRISCDDELIRNGKYMKQLSAKLSGAGIVSEKIVLPPGGRHEFPLPFPNVPGCYALAYEVREAPKDANTSGRLVAGGVRLQRVSPPWRLELTPYYLKYRKVKAQVGCILAKIPDGSLSADFKLLDSKGKVLDEQSCRLEKGCGSVYLDAGTLPEGKPYAVSVRVSDEKKELATLESRQSRPPNPDWWGNELGRKTEVPPGFEPLKMESGDRIALYQRLYDFAGKAFPREIISRGNPLTAAPLRLIAADRDGKPLLWRDETWVCQSSSQGAARFLYTAVNEQVSISVKILVEYDGMIRYDVRLTPRTGIRATLGQLYLEIPVRNEYAKYYHYGYVYTALDKARGHTNDDIGQELAPNAGISIGKLNRYFELHPDGFMPFCAGFYLGNYDRGIQFFAENDKKWNNADENRAIEIRRDADATRLNIHFMDMPTEISTPLDLTFGLIVTPLRDIQRERKDIYNYVSTTLRKPESEANDRRYYEACRDYGFTYARLYVRMDGMFGAPRTYSASQLADFQRNAKLMAEYGLGYLYYSGWGIAPNIPGCEVFAREMYAEPVRARGFGVFTFNLNSTYTDYYLAGVEYMVKNAGAKGVHLDSSQIYFNILSNELDGYGFSRKGRAHGSWPVFASREFSKRLYTMLNDGSVSPERGVINGGFSYPMYAFAGFINTKGSYEEYYHMKSIRDIRLDSFLFRSADLLNGVYGYTSWASYLKLPITENEFTTLNLLHGIAVSATGTLVYPQNTKEPYGRMSAPQGLLSRLFRNFNVPDAKFWPYYLDDKLADTGNPVVYCTAHLYQGSKALVILANLNEKDIDTRIRFDWRKLGLDSKKTIIRDGFLPDITYPVDADGSCKIPIAAQLYRILRIEAVK